LNSGPKSYYYSWRCAGSQIYYYYHWSTLFTDISGRQYTR